MVVDYEVGDAVVVPKDSGFKNDEALGGQYIPLPKGRTGVCERMYAGLVEVQWDDTGHFSQFEEELVEKVKGP